MPTSSDPKVDFAQLGCGPERESVVELQFKDWAEGYREIDAIEQLNAREGLMKALAGLQDAGHVAYVGTYEACVIDVPTTLAFLCFMRRKCSAEDPAENMDIALPRRH